MVVDSFVNLEPEIFFGSLLPEVAVVQVLHCSQASLVLLLEALQLSRGAGVELWMSASSWRMSEARLFGRVFAMSTRRCMKRHWLALKKSIY